ncbi:PLP-dependent aminotransferase family protein [Paenibacillus sp. SC116]|uniref:aminotransferase-like domain-containing protein n=1 Tax=Paenibacillus sp. SC116 TaxID=2968986 RepID=UPI00215A3B97|nr:PLP-dependent aminotransferase family protein [Paenibacillus sp. SC116]MCR8842203.1 PLP-dependent aminotransferase family protein [Paenibacillus sp. SC116]
MKKYQAITADIESKIREGHYKSGQKLPSVRQAIGMYHCSQSTITQAYTELEQRHVIYTIPQSGYYVVDRFGSDQNHRGSFNDEINFSSASPDLHLFPYQDFQHCLNKAIDTHKYNLFTYGHPQGLCSLKQALVSLLADDQIFARTDQIILTSGIQQALEIVARMPFPNQRSTVLVEQPSYDLYLRYLEREGIPVRGVARTAQGVDWQALEEAFSSGEIKFFYTMSRYQNPLGTSYNKEERRKLARLASTYDVYIVEDDYMADLGVDRQFDPIYSYNQSSHVIYLKSFSKMIFPGLRLGVAVLPEQLVQTFQSYKSYGDTSLLSQAALEVYIRNGMYQRHKQLLRKEYSIRMQALHAAVTRNNDKGLVQLSETHSSIYTQFKLPLTINMDQLIKRLDSKQITVAPGNPFYLSGWLKREKFLRMSISRTTVEQIEHGIQSIMEELQHG